jgi:hypothetical protein
MSRTGDGFRASVVDGLSYGDALHWGWLAVLDEKTRAEISVKSASMHLRPLRGTECMSWILRSILGDGLEIELYHFSESLRIRYEVNGHPKTVWMTYNEDKSLEYGWSEVRAHSDLTTVDDLRAFIALVDERVNVHTERVKALAEELRPAPPVRPAAPLPWHPVAQGRDMPGAGQLRGDKVPLSRESRRKVHRGMCGHRPPRGRDRCSACGEARGMRVLVGEGRAQLHQASGQPGGQGRLARNTPAMGDVAAQRLRPDIAGRCAIAGFDPARRACPRDLPNDRRSGLITGTRWPLRCPDGESCRATTGYAGRAVTHR